MPLKKNDSVKNCFDVDRLPCRQGNGLNMTFCGPARDTLLSNQDTEKLNFDTNYIPIIVIKF